MGEILNVRRVLQTACIMRLHQLLHSAAPREITAIIELGFALCDYCINLHSAAPRAINSVIALYAVRLAYIIVLWLSRDTDPLQNCYCHITKLCFVSRFRCPS